MSPRYEGKPNLGDHSWLFCASEPPAEPWRAAG